MDRFYGGWRLRFSIHAALLLTLSALIGFPYRATLTRDDPPCAASSDRAPDRWCEFADPPSQRPQCDADSPCFTDTVLENRWRSAHQQGLLHALLLFGFAIGAPYFRIGRFNFTIAGWALIIGCWGAPLAALVQALITPTHANLLGFLFLRSEWFQAHGPFAPQGPRMACLVVNQEIAAWECVGLSIGAIAGPVTFVALFFVASRSAWEVLRDGIAPYTWRNWMRIVRARPRRIVEPTSEAELLAAVQDALDAHMTVRAFGGRYSWSPIAPTDDLMIDMRQLRAVVVEKGAARVSAQAGATLREITDALAEHGLMLATTTVNPWVQLGGALALGCHGTGIHHAPFTDLVTKIVIVQYQGSGAAKKATTATHQRPASLDDGSAAWRDWNALLVNLGCLGVMVEITLECEPLHDVRIVDERRPMRETIESDSALHQIVVGRRFSEIFWFPYNRELFVRSWDVIPGERRADFAVWFRLRQWAVAKIFGPFVFGLLALFPFLTPACSRLFHRAFGNLRYEVAAPNAMQYERYFHRVFDMGYAIPLEPHQPGGFERFRLAWLEVVDRLDALAHQALYPQNLVMHVRFGRNSHAYLAPNGGDGCSAFFEIITHANTPNHADHFAGVERYWQRLGGRAHWAKMTADPDRLIDNYAPSRVEAFREVRRAMDPEQVFLNDYVRRVLHIEEP